MCSVFSLNYTVAHASTTEATVLLARFTSGPETIEKPGGSMILCVCVFIKLHITTQSGPVILVIICHSH